MTDTICKMHQSLSRAYISFISIARPTHFCVRLFRQLPGALQPTPFPKYAKPDQALISASISLYGYPIPLMCSIQ